jgi:drug/metabolite transporter (DMT)-like permease
MQRTAILYALASAALFGASTPLAKMLLGAVPPLLLAATLYLGSGIGLLCWLALRRALRREPPTSLGGRDYLWLGAAITAGGVIAPVFLVFGLVRTDGGTASLLLNLEAVLTAVIAWVAFRENVDRRIFLGMVAIVAGGVLLAWQESAARREPPRPHAHRGGLPRVGAGQQPHAPHLGRRCSDHRLP